MSIVNKKVKLQLVGMDGNCFAIMGAFQRQAKKENWTSEEINLVLQESQKDDYNHLLCTIMDHCESPKEENDNNEEDDEDDICMTCGEQSDDCSCSRYR
jgi:hypothetical protein